MLETHASSYSIMSTMVIQNSLRHSLSMSGYFVMVDQSTDPMMAAKKYHHWKIDPTRAADLLSSMDQHYSRLIATESILKGEKSIYILLKIIIRIIFFVVVIIGKQTCSTCGVSMNPAPVAVEDQAPPTTSLVAQAPPTTSLPVQLAYPEGANLENRCCSSADLNDLIATVANSDAVTLLDCSVNLKSVENDNNLLPADAGHTFSFLMDLKLDEDDEFIDKQHSSKKRAREVEDLNTEQTLLPPLKRQRLV